MSGPSFHLRLPPRSLFKFPPDPEPRTLPSPPNAGTFGSPFSIDPKIYNDALSVWVPATISISYFVSVALWNAINRKRGYKPYAISRTRIFKLLVIVHNVFLALYSAITFVAMMRALRHSWPGRIERYDKILGIPWPAFRTQNGLAGAADALCKMHGPRGLGNAASYTPSTGLWDIKNKLFSLSGAGTPDATDVGRLWNEGLAFWGWWFYLSKFYEVVDTMIILLKGKRSSTLQTYHHAGAMWCMWAGIRYMSSPIWMFAWINSGIHALMYTYYTLSSLGVRVPQALKRMLTTAQISQFLMGFTFAACHLFVSYTVPVSTPYSITKKVLAAASAAPSVVSSVASEMVQPTMSAGIGSILKKVILRAAGEEGLAENVRNQQGERFGHEKQQVEHWEHQTETHYRDEWHEIPCIDTTGQAFAIWLNLVYLAPLTVLFVRFFIRSYTRRTSAKATHPTKHKTHAAKQASKDAASGVEHKIEHAGQKVEKKIEHLIENVEQNAGSPSQVRALAGKWEKNFEQTVSHTYTSVKQEARSSIERASSPAQKVKQTAKQFQEKFSEIASNAKENVKPGVDQVASKMESSIEFIEQKGQELADRVMKGGWEPAKEQAGNLGDIMAQKAENVKEQLPTVQDASDKISAKADDLKSVAQETAEKAQDKAEDLKDTAKDAAKQGQEKAEDVSAAAQDTAKKGEAKANEVKSTARDTATDAKDTAKDTINVAEKAVKDTSDDVKSKAEDVKEEAKSEANEATSGAPMITEEKSKAEGKDQSRTQDEVKEEPKEDLHEPAEAPKPIAEAIHEAEEHGDEKPKTFAEMAKESEAKNAEKEEEASQQETPTKKPAENGSMVLIKPEDYEDEGETKLEGTESTNPLLKPDH